MYNVHVWYFVISFYLNKTNPRFNTLKTKFISYIINYNKCISTFKIYSSSRLKSGMRGEGGGGGGGGVEGGGGGGEGGGEGEGEVTVMCILVLLSAV